MQHIRHLCAGLLFVGFTTFAFAEERAPTTQKDKEYRDRRPHRRRQDNGDGAHPILHGQDVQDRRGPRRDRHHGLPAPGAGARHHHHFGGDHLPLARPRTASH